MKKSPTAALSALLVLSISLIVGSAAASAERRASFASGVRALAAALTPPRLVTLPRRACRRRPGASPCRRLSLKRLALA